jgi:tRNA-specific 2-thiouridylase
MAQTVYVGMSGGVDSSVTAALLKERGYNVVGVYMKNWTEDLPGMKCPWAEDLADAKRVAVQLDIPFKVFDFQKEYKQKVVDYMISEYQAGRTPNPDIMCNQEVKFKIFLETALEDGADLIATGHYARVEHGDCASLLTGLDANKDQSYFLYRVTEDALAHTLMPIGEMEKPAVREKAAELGLITATKKDSQGICFVGKVGIKDFLSQYVTSESGDVIDKTSGKVVGQHDGAIFYTIGQRQGLGIGGGLPYYVVAKDMDKNEVYVTTKLDDEALWLNDLELENLHWINEPPEVGKTYKVRTRYRARLLDAELTELTDQKALLKLTETERAITSGQSTVLYDGDRVFGGGIVKN